MWSERAIDIKMRKKLLALQASGQYRYDTEKRRLVPNAQGNIEHPWAFFGCGVNARNCHLWTKIMFHHFGLVPAFCRFRCHKIVAKPKNVESLIQTYNFANAIPFLTGVLTIPSGKAGMDRREYTSNPWAVFWYANNPAHARKLFKTIDGALRAVKMDEVADTLIIKKSCTEMEVMLGPTDGEKWKTMTEEEQLMEDRLGDIFLAEPEDIGPQPSWNINSIIESWLDFARMHGDSSGDERFGLHSAIPVTYHEQIKKEK